MGEVNVSAGTAFLQKYATALQPAEAHTMVLQLLQLHSTTTPGTPPQTVLLQSALAAAEAGAAAASSEAGSEWHEEVIRELKFIAHRVKQGSHKQEVSKFAGRRL